MHTIVVQFWQGAQDLCTFVRCSVQFIFLPRAWTIYRSCSLPTDGLRLLKLCCAYEWCFINTTSTIYNILFNIFPYAKTNVPQLSWQPLGAIDVHCLHVFLFIFLLLALQWLFRCSTGCLLFFKNLKSGESESSSIVWICATSQAEGQTVSVVSVVDAHNPSISLNTITISTAHVLCIAGVPGELARGLSILQLAFGNTTSYIEAATL